MTVAWLVGTIAAVVVVIAHPFQVDTLSIVASELLVSAIAVILCKERLLKKKETSWNINKRTTHIRLLVALITAVRIAIAHKTLRYAFAMIFATEMICATTIRVVAAEFILATGTVFVSIANSMRLGAIVISTLKHARLTNAWRTVF